MRRIDEIDDQFHGAANICISGLAMVAVHPSHRDRGIGTMLAMLVLDRASRSEGLPVLVQVDNETGRFYKRCGFEPVSEINIDLKDFGEQTKMWNLAWSELVCSIDLCGTLKT